MKPRLIQAYRLAVLLAIVWLVHAQHQWMRAQRGAATIEFEAVEEFFPKGVALGPIVPGHGEQTVIDRLGARIGFVVQTSPNADGVVGYSGPTNTLLAFDAKGEILGVKILESEDTSEHVEDVELESKHFLALYAGLDWEGAAALNLEELDGVSGATLTSLAIREGIALRLTGRQPNLRFPGTIDAEEARSVFPGATGVESDPEHPETLRAVDAEGEVLGLLLRTGYLADRFKGYQGPTDTLVALTPDGEKILAVKLRRSYDTPVYVKDVTRDRFFFEDFENLATAEAAGAEYPEALGIEGVSGATMTSYAMAEGVLAVVRDFLAERERRARPNIVVSGGDIGLLAVVLLGIVMAFTRLRSHRWFRRVYQVGLIAYLGFLSGDMVAQALLLGWARNGIAWSAGIGLLALVAAALLVPIATGRQVYCHHVCPHGAAQQLLMAWIPKRWRIRVGHTLAHRIERLVPGLLLFWVLIVGMLALAHDPASIEPFDAYLFRTAGWATIGIFVVSLIASAFVPMAYCRFGCPTGRLLEFVRYRRGGEHFGGREVAAAVFLGLAVVLYWQRAAILG